MLGALTFPDEHKAIADWLLKKQEFGLHAYGEVKWNDRVVPLEQRRAFVPLLNNAIGIVIIDDSTKQAAAEPLCTQVWQYCHDEKKDGFRLRFDENIIEDGQRLKSHLRSYYPPCVGLSEHDSDYEALLQYADFLAGAIKLKIDFGLGTRNPNIKVTVRGEDPGSTTEMEQSFYFFAALRYCLWGHVQELWRRRKQLPPKKNGDGARPCSELLCWTRGHRQSCQLRRWGLHGLHTLSGAVVFGECHLFVTRITAVTSK